MHHAAELDITDGDETTSVDHFAALCTSEPRARNTISLDTATVHVFGDRTGTMTD